MNPQVRITLNLDEEEAKAFKALAIENNLTLSQLATLLRKLLVILRQGYSLTTEVGDPKIFLFNRQDGRGDYLEGIFQDGRGTEKRRDKNVFYLIHKVYETVKDKS